jgi:hypothetical protein
MEELKKKINKILPLSMENIYHKNKLILSEKTPEKIDNAVEEKVKNPSKNIQVFLIRARFNNNSNHPFIISVIMTNITPESRLEHILGYMKTFVYTKDDLEKYGFDKSDLIKIMNAVKNRTVSFRKITSPISEVYESKKK